MKIVKWSFGDYGDNTRVDAKELIIGENLLIQIGQYDGLEFSITGLGLTKNERKFFGHKFLHKGNFVNIYLGKLIITHDKRGYRENLSSVNINWEMELKDYIKHFIRYSVSPKLKEKFNKAVSKAAKKILFRKKEIFIIERYYEAPKRIKCDRLTAFQLAAKYDADLIQNGRYLLSPLGFDWDSNRELIVKNLGKIFNNFKLYGYSDWSDVEIIKL